MKRTIKLALSASLLLGATSAFATNGDVMIGQGAKSRSMGGVGIAKSFGAESALSNPASISSVENMEFTGAVTYFNASVAFGSNAAASAQGSTAAPTMADSDTAASIIPEMSFAHRLSNELVYGISVNGIAGMGTDYDDNLMGTATDNGSFNMKTALSILKVSIPVAYTVSDITIGIAPVFQYGTLEMSHYYDSSAQGTPAVPADFKKLDNGASSDSAFGLELGLAYDMKAAGVEGLTLAAIYKTKIEMEYANTISSSVAVFGGAAMTGVNSGDKLDQPAEMGLGVAYANGENTIALDYKNIQWSDAAGYGDFGWEDQNVFALGYEYATKAWAVRLGYNYGANPIAEQDASPVTAGNSAYGNGVKNFFNLSGFPGVVEQHITLGGGYTVSKALTIDGSFVYAPEVTYSYDTTGLTAGMIAGGGGTYAGETSTADVTHSQMGITIAGTYKF